MEDYMFKPDVIREKCFKLNKSIAEKGLELNIVPGQHISEKICSWLSYWHSQKFGRSPNFAVLRQF